VSRNPLLGARRAAEEPSADPQALNRLWWERLPMTYVDFAAPDRLPRDRQGFAAMEATLLAHSPLLRRRFDWAGRRGERVLDLGCGPGTLSALLAKAGARVTAVDLTDQGTRLARANARHQGLDFAVARADAERLGLGAAAFDYVLAWGVVHHTRDTARALAEIGRVLRPGGCGMVMVYHRRSLRYWLLGLWWLVGRGRLLRGDTMASVQRHFTDGYYHRHYTRRELLALVGGAGLVPTRVTVTEMERPILPLVPAPLDRWLKSRFGWLLVVELRRPEA
jgi:2-polyprenyl-3-methyl-5-hydroxy-6-metoxy-1,4-benzoquinol methylase